MADQRDETAEKALWGARTEAGKAGDAGAGAADRRGLAEILAADLKRLGAELDQDGEQLDLIDGSPDLDSVDAIAAAANLTASQRRARGRPAGSTNRRNTAVFDYLEQLGHRDPLVTLSMLQTADTKALAKALGADTPKGRLAVLAIQAKAAHDLLPFKYAKRPQAIEMHKRELHLFVAGQMDTGGAANGARPGLSIFGGQIVENQGVTEAQTVRIEGGDPHDGQEPSDINDLSGSTG